MSWWTKNRKKVGLAAGLLGAGAAMVASGGAAAPAVLPALEGGGGALLGDGALTAALVPGLEATGPGSQAAMLAAQNAGLGPTALAKTAEAAATANGLSPLAQFGGNALGGIDKVMGGISKAGKGMYAANTMMNFLTGGQQPVGVAPPPMQGPVTTGKLPTGYDQLLTEEEKRRLGIRG